MKAHITGNIVFEKALAGTRSATIVYVIQDKAYAFKHTELWPALLELHKAGKTRFTMGGDRWANPLLIVKTTDILPAAQEINLGEVQ